jgi:hypothetical protein
LSELPQHSSSELIIDARDRGLWVLLQNDHLALSWMPRLEQIIAGMHRQKTHRRFRLCLVTISSIDFPIGILYQGQTLISEISKEMHHNVTTVYNSFDPEDDRQIDQLSQERVLLFRLALLHAGIVERLQLRAFGWNMPSECNSSDFIISMRHL